jgi:hypothetical protein
MKFNLKGKFMKFLVLLALLTSQSVFAAKLIRCQAESATTDGINYVTYGTIIANLESEKIEKSVKLGGLEGFKLELKEFSQSGFKDLSIKLVNRESLVQVSGFIHNYNLEQDFLFGGSGMINDKLVKVYCTTKNIAN